MAAGAASRLLQAGAGMVYIAEEKARHEQFLATLPIFLCVEIWDGVQCREVVR
jgi:hypothetical protein